VEIKEFFERNGAKFSEILNKIVPSFAQLSPYLVFATTVIASGGAPGALSIPLSSFVEKVLEKISIDYPVSRILDKITGKDSSKIRKEEIEELKNAIEKLSRQLEESSRQDIDFDEQIVQFTDGLINSKEFKNLEKNIEGLNSKINVLRGELSECLKNIQEELGIIITVSLPKIEVVLEKDARKSPEFFRTAGPIWIDFQEGSVYERPEVNHIIEELKGKDIVVIKGNPASGKSVILRNIGYKLAKEDIDTYFIGLKTSPDWKASEITKIRHGYIVIDDAHLDVKFVEALLLNRPNAKVIIASRNIDLEKVFGPTSEYKFAECLKNAIEVKACNTADEIIQKFEEKNASIPEEIKNRLAKDNLWILAWEMKSYEEFGSIEEESVFKTVKTYLESLPNVENPENVILPIAAFYKYEIPLRKPFIEYFAEKETTRGLEVLNEISTFSSERKDYLVLHHSEVAEVYVKTFDYFEDFGRNAKNKISKKYEELFGEGKPNTLDLEVKLFNIYLREYPEEITNVINYDTARDKNLCNEIYTRNFSDMLIGLENDIEKIEWFISHIAGTSKEVARKIINSLDVNNLIEKINDRKDVETIAAFISEIEKVNKGIAEKITNGLDVKVLINKINDEEDIFTIEACINKIEKVNKGIAEKITNGLDVKVLINKINDEKDISTIGMFIGGGFVEEIRVITVIIFEACVSGIAKINKEIAKKITKGLDIKILIEKIDKEKDIWKIEACVSGIWRANKEIANKIVKRLNFKSLIEKIEMEEDIGKIGELIRVIRKVNEAFSSKILNAIEPEKREKVLKHLKESEKK